MVHIQELQDKANSSTGLSHVPCQPMGIPSPRGMISRDSQRIGYLRKRCRKSTCSVWTIRSTLRQIKEFGLRLLADWDQLRQATLRNREKRVTQEPMDYSKYQLHILARRFRLGTHQIVQDALVQKMMKMREIKSRTCISTSSQTHALIQEVDRRRRGGTNQRTIWWRRSQLKGGTSLILKWLMQTWPLHRRGSNWSVLPKKSYCRGTESWKIRQNS